MRVMQVNKLFYPHVGGIEQVVYDLTTGLKPFVKESIVLAAHNARQTVVENIDGIQVYRIGGVGTYLSMPVAPTFPLWMHRLAKTVDILHSHHPFPLGDASYLLSGVRTPAVVTWHSEIVRQRRLLKVYLPLLNAFLRRVRKIIVTSPPLLDNSSLLRPFYDKCEVVPLGIDLTKHQLNDEERQHLKRIKEQYKNRPIVLFVGRLVYYKGLEFLIRAMQNVPEALLFVVGTGPLGIIFQSLAKELNMDQRVVFWGSLPDSQLRILYHACDVFVLPSVERSEAFGLVQLEAMSCGKPIISSNLPTGVPYVNQDGETGIVVPPKHVEALTDAINAILFNPSLKEQFGLRALQRVTTHFSKETMAYRVSEIYHAI